MNSSKTTNPLSLFNRIPKHVAIIMDGNGRWARRRMLDRLVGHKKGVKVVKEVVECCSNLGIPALTLYAFSTENWLRPKFEVNGIMQILLKFLKSEQDFLCHNDVRIKVIGQFYRLPLSVRESLSSVIKNTSGNESIQLTLALSYGGRNEILDMVLRIASEVRDGVIDLESVNLELMSKYLSTNGLPDPDLLIRTGGEIRVSNFLLWQIAYTEFFFTDTLWPDFGSEEFNQIIKDFPKRNRRFGSIIT